MLGLAADVGRQCRAEGLAGSIVTLKIRFTGFETHTRRLTRDRPTNHDQAIYRTALDLAAERSFRNQAIRLIGVGLSGWDSAESRQLDLFHSERDAERENRLYSTLDEVQERFGRDSLRLGMPAHKRSR